MKKQLDRFVLTSRLSQQSDGTLFSGEESLPGGITRPVTIKVFPGLTRADGNREKQLVEEMRVLAALAGQPHVVTFYGMGITDSIPWIAMEQATQRLSDILGPAPASPRQVARLIEHLASGLTSLHALEPPLLHNRLFPVNVLVCAQNHYKLTEFGLAAPLGAEPTLGMDIVRYAAPELLSKEFGKVGPAADLYALGHIAYEMALGAKLHRQQFPAVWTDSRTDREAEPGKWQAWHHSMPTAAPPVEEVVKNFPAPLSEMIARLMAKPQSARYATAEQVLADLSAGAPSGPPAAPGRPMEAAPSAGQLRPSGRPTSTGSAVPPPPPPPAGFQKSAPAVAAPASAPSFASGGEQYFVRLRNRVTGPFDVGALQRMARQGQLSRLHQVSTDQRSWTGAASIEGVFG